MHGIRIFQVFMTSEQGKVCEDALRQRLAAAQKIVVQVRIGHNYTGHNYIVVQARVRTCARACMRAGGHVCGWACMQVAGVEQAGAR